MSDPRFLQEGFAPQLGHLVEEIGEAGEKLGDVLAAAGKTLRWGRESVNPLLPAAQVETNEAWLIRAIAAAKPELLDVLDAMGRLEATLEVASNDPLALPEGYTIRPPHGFVGAYTAWFNGAPMPNGGFWRSEREARLFIIQSTRGGHLAADKDEGAR